MSKTYQQDLDNEVQELYGEYNVTLLSLSLSFSLSLKLISCLVSF